MDTNDSPAIPVKVTVTETFTFDIDPEWFSEDVGENPTRDELWDAVKRWNKAHPAYLWDWIDGEGDDSTLVMERTDTGEKLTDVESA